MFALETHIFSWPSRFYLVCMLTTWAASVQESEEMIVPPEDLTGEFVVTFDPLDGSSNIDAGVNVGTIFGIYRRISDSGPGGHNPGNIDDILQVKKWHFPRAHAAGVSRSRKQKAQQAGRHQKFEVLALATC
jgi:hypothetical protein